MCKCLVSTYREDFAASSPRKLARSGEGVLLHALQMYRSPVMSQDTTPQIGNDKGQAHLVGSGPILVPARSIRALEGSVKPAGVFPHDALIERVEATCNLAELPYRVTVGVAVVTVDSKGRVPIQLANFSSRDVYLHPRTPATAISTFHMEPTLEFVREDESHVCVHRAGSDDEVKCNSKADAILSRMDVGDLAECQQERLQQVIGRYQSTFSEDEDDLGFCDLVKHKIVTTDDKPIRAPHRRVPPHQWPEVRNYIQRSLDQASSESHPVLIHPQ